mmetsp:Transcript_14027/g.20077  ORF Transcript_14027/g.20077 Transcript_14027/m.20077 type:complete len:2365 (+) Transcript_14027:253-7347(+)|eukprot:CAMPEP_0172415054 /NCGR_PEP_ID=MMETSP1064-20121228/1595_1 /TAXON_ID=202472 /ORGANISM="Aulacoseira subarctica , Strain CCAP 1002/5" /LENGTH=2364 /DNA_ID=CAMNT_0013151951 /DNA_START=171 /DNA_END=7265 /DNA_ORIENTATION=-
MKRVSSSVCPSSHRRFSTVDEYVNELGGPAKCAIEKVLIANNGVAAVKAIRSIRKWAYDIFGDEKAIQFVVMATPEDLRANAEYIRMADTIVDVPGGSNNHNYANVMLIVELARLHGVRAVWAGWGHASENPLLPEMLSKTLPLPIKFIGPAAAPMQALGDKIGSTIIAQTAGVPCIAWNGQHVKANYCKTFGKLPSQAYNDATIKSVSEACAAAKAIGFPVMIKASEGGGGKGIRKVVREEDVATAYRQVCGEVPGSPIFIMKLSDKSRHLEVQILADEYGDAIALNGRDCSVQRRHQKIIEEGPPNAARQDVWEEMEKAAVSLAKAVGYANAGTVEYLYSEVDHKFYFLELNPRLQVEHPVTEMITGVNLPAAQLQVAMGIPLRHIPEIRELYGRKRFEDNASTYIDFDNEKRCPPRGHCIAVRITAENAEAGFKPTSGVIQELNFRSTANVWGYFSMDSSGSIHEFADSQFGHLFANGPDREQARRNMVLALKELSIRGDISTTVDYISKLIELDDYVNNNIHTGWLDQLIQNGSLVEISSALSLGNSSNTGGNSNNNSSRGKKRDLSNHMYVIIGATVLSYDHCLSGEKQFEELLQKGQLPSQALLSMEHNLELILDNVKYRLRCTRIAPNTFSIIVLLPEETRKTSAISGFVETNVRLLSDGGYLISMAEKSHVAYLTNKGDAATGMRLNVGGATIVFSADYNPSSLRTDVAGKLVKKLVADASHVVKGQPYAEIEVMKMFMPLKVEESGILTWNVNEGASLVAGDLLASLELDNPDNVATPAYFEGNMNVQGWMTSSQAQHASTSAARPHIMLRKAIERLQVGMAGYVLTENDLSQAMEDLQNAVRNPLLPVLEAEEKLSVLSARIDSNLFAYLNNMIADFKIKCEQAGEDKAGLCFRAAEIEERLVQHSRFIKDASEHSSFVALTGPLREVVSPYINNQVLGTPGSERALICFIELLREWITVERWFCDGKSYADAVNLLRLSNKEDVAAVLKVCRAHSQVASTSRIALRIIDTFGEQDQLRSESLKRGFIRFNPKSVVAAEPCLSEIRDMGGKNTVHAEVALRARKVLLQESMPSRIEREGRVKDMVLSMASPNKLADEKEVVSSKIRNFIEQNESFTDLLFPLLRNFATIGERTALLELYARQLLRGDVVKETFSNNETGSLRVTFHSRPSENVLGSVTSVKSMSELSRLVRSSSSILSTGDLSESDSFHLEKRAASYRPPSHTIRTGIFQVVHTLGDAERALEAACKAFPEYQDSSRCNTDPINILHIFVLDNNINAEQMDEVGARCEKIAVAAVSKLAQADIRRVSFVFCEAPTSNDAIDLKENPMPSIYTYRASFQFKEDSLFRNIEPVHAYHLELTRLVKNFGLKSLGSRCTANGRTHLYMATPKALALAKDPKASKEPRVFVRALNFVKEFTSTCYESILVDALNALDLSSESNGLPDGAGNHLFVNMVSDHERVIDPSVIEQVVASILKRHGKRVTLLGVVEVETRIVCCLSTDSPPIALRMVASNPTGYVHVMNTYVEAADDTGTRRVFRLIGGTKASLAGSGDSSWENMEVDAPYPLTRPFDAQRNAALKASDTLYCYDLPALFEAAVENQWNGVAAKTEGSVAPCRPLMVMYTTELVVQKKPMVGGSDKWTMKDYLNGDLELVQLQRGAGGNDVGMVAWLMTLKTVEYPEGRQLVIIANDITFKAGSFGTREDVVFKMASEFARGHSIPRLFVAANSGARIGLADSVRKSFRVAFKDPKRPENGFDFIYITEEDYFRLGSKVNAEPAVYNGEAVYKLTDVIGSEPDLGVENLKGSGLIAGETSAAYNDVFTLTIVLGRTVGIGAYLVRLGQRTIQKTTASPIILTGYQALNKLMGCEVYSTNDQLGGPGIMYSNGVSHLVAKDHLKAITLAIEWLSYVPSIRGGLLPITDIRGVDVIERSIDFTPLPGTPYDPRHLLAGKEDDRGEWMSGFFDKGSFTETLAGWAKSVVVGRARLGGIPMGVIITENRTAENIKPADPADVKASEAVIQEAGCVWFPNSAYKTAQAINDFRTEDLPLMIFANWRGFSGGQRDMFDEVLKYGSLIVDAFVAYTQPVFVFIPPFAEIRGGAWVVLDSSINSSVMEMYAAARTARGGVLEANGAASVKYRTKDLLASMHRLDDKLKTLDSSLEACQDENAIKEAKKLISDREQSLLPVYEQIAVQFCDLHDTPGRMKAVGVIEREVEWTDARTFFFWRLRRKLAEFDVRRKILEAGEVGRSIKRLTATEASAVCKEWFLDSPGTENKMWEDDKAVLSWMAHHYSDIEMRIKDLTRSYVADEVLQVLTAGGTTEEIGTAGMIEGLSRAYQLMGKTNKEKFKSALKAALDI